MKIIAIAKSKKSPAIIITSNKMFGEFLQVEIAF